MKLIQITYKKQPQKYLQKTDTNTRTKLTKAINNLLQLNGDIVKLEGTNKYRLKIHHYRIIFTYDRNSDTIIIERIGTRTDIYKGGLQ